MANRILAAQGAILNRFAPGTDAQRKPGSSNTVKKKIFFP